MSTLGGQRGEGSSSSDTEGGWGVDQENPLRGSLDKIQFRKVSHSNFQ
jgi:hypothetical protein